MSPGYGLINTIDDREDELSYNTFILSYLLAHKQLIEFFELNITIDETTVYNSEENDAIFTDFFKNLDTDPKKQIPPFLIKWFNMVFPNRKLESWDDFRHNLLDTDAHIGDEEESLGDADYNEDEEYEDDEGFLTKLIELHDVYKDFSTENSEKSGNSDFSENNISNSEELNSPLEIQNLIEISFNKIMEEKWEDDELFQYETEITDENFTGLVNNEDIEVNRILKFIMDLLSSLIFSILFEKYSQKEGGREDKPFAKSRFSGHNLSSNKFFFELISDMI